MNAKKIVTKSIFAINRLHAKYHNIYGNNDASNNNNDNVTSEMINGPLMTSLLFVVLGVINIIILVDELCRCHLIMMVITKMLAVERTIDTQYQLRSLFAVFIHFPLKWETV